ncbi:nurim [Caerostris darwini]|uniref:Nuclear envelope membrane protein n=1 Tax=Caerostris darwini TaxID=1538125 RepID=A0AAV4WIA0_9ARAC|nr:nurim [Caerostris darwini]
MSFKDNLGLSMCIGVLCCCIFTLGQLVMFLSSHAPLRQNRYPPFIYFGHFDSLWLQILIDLCLVSLFVLQHSFQNCVAVKEFLISKGLGVFERLLYNLGSCLVLQVLMQLWHPTPGWVVWEISTASHPTAWWLFAAIHCIAWLVIYGGCFVIDITELLGAKQVFYSLQGWPDPLSLKSEGLQPQDVAAEGERLMLLLNSSSFANRGKINIFSIWSEQVTTTHRRKKITYGLSHRY